MRRKDLETEKAFYFIGYGFEETVTAEAGVGAAVRLAPKEDRVKEPEDAGGDAVLQHFLRRDGRIRHGGRRGRGILQRGFPMDGDFSFQRERRNGRLARGSGLARRADAIDFPA